VEVDAAGDTVGDGTQDIDFLFFEPTIELPQSRHIWHDVRNLADVLGGRSCTFRMVSAASLA